MPNVFFLARPDVNDALTSSVFHKIAGAVRLAISDTLPNLKPNQVAVYRIHVDDVDGGVSGIQIFCIASHSEERMNRLSDVRLNIAEALLKLDREDEECRAFFKVAGTADSWPIMPFGSWQEVVFGANS